MLLTREVEVVLNPENIKRYEDLGYSIPRIKNKWGKIQIPRGTTITVKIDDLSFYSNIKVKIKCDGCGKIMERTWHTYMRCVRDNKEYYCNKCTSNGDSKFISFEDWCIENNRHDLLDRWDYNLDNCKPSDITKSTHYKYYFKCPNGIHKSKARQIDTLTKHDKTVIICEECNSFAQWGIDNIGENFLEKYWDYKQNKINPWGISHGSNMKIWIKCQEKDYHGSYDTSPKIFVNGNRCPYCATFHGMVHPKDSLGALLEEKGLLSIWSDKNSKSPFIYTPNSNIKLWWKCSENIHNDYCRTANNSYQVDFRCPDCQFSKGENRINDYLINYDFIKISQEEYDNSNNICNLNNNYYMPQKTFNKLRGLGNGLLSYDFYLPKQNLLIEYDGEFHYKPIKNNKNELIKYAKKRFKKQKIHDKLKDDYAKDNNIKLLRIPYWDFDNIEEILDKELNINNKVPLDISKGVLICDERRI